MIMEWLLLVPWTSIMMIINGFTFYPLPLIYVMSFCVLLNDFL